MEKWRFESKTSWTLSGKAIETKGSCNFKLGEIERMATCLTAAKFVQAQHDAPSASNWLWLEAAGTACTQALMVKGKNFKRLNGS